jgi:hypothetical protein
MRPATRQTSRTLVVVLVVVFSLLSASCGDSSDVSTSDTIGLGGGPEQLDPSASVGPPQGAGAAPSSPLGVSSSCLARIDGDLRQQMVSPGSVAAVRTDHWLSFEQFVSAAQTDDASDGVAPLDGWLAMTCTLPNGDTVTARTVDSTPADRVPLGPATHVVAPGLPDAISDEPDPSGVATWTVAVTLDGALFVPLDGGQAIVTTFDRDEVVVTVTALLTEVEPLGEPRSISLDASFRATCGAPYGGCQS